MPYSQVTALASYFHLRMAPLIFPAIFAGIAGILMLRRIEIGGLSVPAGQTGEDQKKGCD